MDRVEIVIYSVWDEDTSPRKMGFAKGYPQYFSWIEPKKRKVTSAYRCPVGGETTRDYWYMHFTGKSGDKKLCREHEVIETYR